MARHSSVRKIDIGEERRECEAIGHSVDEHAGCISPTDEGYIRRGANETYLNDYVPTGSSANPIDEGSEIPDDDYGDGYYYDHQDIHHDDVTIDHEKLRVCLDSVQGALPLDDCIDFDKLELLCIRLHYNANNVLDELFKSEDDKQTQRSRTTNTASASRATTTKPTTSKVTAANGSRGSGDMTSPRVISPSIVPRVISPRPATTKLPSSMNRGPLFRSTDDTPTPPVNKRLEVGLGMRKVHSDRDFASRFDRSVGIHDTTPTVSRKLPKRTADAKPVLNLIVVGHVDAGKSTLVGRMLYELGEVNQKAMDKFKHDAKREGKESFRYAWIMDTDQEERSRGITKDIAIVKFETASKQVVLLDAPGHKDLIPAMITGAAQADVAILVVNATTGEFETGLNGQTREHSLLVRSLGVSQLAVAINQMDRVDYSEERFVDIQRQCDAFFKQTGFQSVKYVPCVALEGENLTVLPKDSPLAQWYDGPSLMDVIDQFSTSAHLNVDKPLRFAVSDVLKAGGGGVAGKVITGALAVNDKVICKPSAKSDIFATVKSIHMTDEVSSDAVFAGDQCVLTLTGGADLNSVAIGNVICHPESPIKQIRRFEARIVMFNVDVPLIKGSWLVLHCQCVCEPVTLKRLVAQLNRAGVVLKRKPRVITKNTVALVEIECEKLLCLELYEDNKALGRVTLRLNGQTVAGGTVTKLL